MRTESRRAVSGANRSRILSRASAVTAAATVDGAAAAIGKKVDSKAAYGNGKHQEM